VFALQILEDLDLVELVLPCGCSGQVFAATDAFALQELEEALRHGIVVAIPSSAHSGVEIVLAKKHLPLAAGERRSLVVAHPRIGSLTVVGRNRGEPLPCNRAYRWAI
jgi:hypothetical protein